MTYANPVTATVTRGATPGKDKYGDPVGGPISTRTIEDCAYAPRLADELDDRGRDGQVVGYTLYCPVGSDIRRADHVVINAPEFTGMTFTVEGAPAIWARNPFNAFARGGVVAQLEFVEGT